MNSLSYITHASVRSETGWPLAGTAWMKPSTGWFSR